MGSGIWKNYYKSHHRTAAHTAGTKRLMGIAGAGRGTGVTHFCILAANYLTSCLQHKTALIQWNDHGDFERLGRILKGSQPRGPQEDTEYFRLLEADYYTCGDSQVLAHCMEAAYDDIIIDFGELREDIHAEWLRCGTKLIAAPAIIPR